MQTVRTEKELKGCLAGFGNKTLGFVPTMGALHSGHISLIGLCKQLSDIALCSIFVNPTQFNDQKDFEKYPVTIDGDIKKLTEAACDVLFLPSTEEIYPNGFVTGKDYRLGRLENVLEGKFRPGHFRGVCQVMDRLLHLAMPDVLVMGAKDYQQCLVVQHLLDTEPDFKKIRLVKAATVREASGLAKSSRNSRLPPAAREGAKAIFETLNFVKSHLKKGNNDSLLREAEQRLREAGFEKTDYVAIADPATLAPMENWDGHQNAVILAAAFLNGVRLIDNIMLNH